MRVALDGLEPPGANWSVNAWRVDPEYWMGDELGVEMHERTMGKQLKALEFSHLSVRP